MLRTLTPRSARKYRERTEVSCCIKYFMFAFNVIFWLFGGILLAVGLWAWVEKEMVANLNKLTNITLDPALIFVIIGFTMFVIGFTGCVGSLRENTCLLVFFMITLAIIFMLEVLLCVLGILYKDWVLRQIEVQARNMISDYREDMDLQNLVDWVQQEWLGCCGVHRYGDWEANVYFNCSSPGVEACGVPFSCCKHANMPMANRQCGYEMMKLSHDYDRNIQIYTIGCIPAGGKWLAANLVPVAIVVICIAFLKIFGFCFAQNLRSDIQAQRAKWAY